MNFLKDLLIHFKSIKDKPIIITGDYNIAHTEIDIHDPVGLDGASGFMPEERAWMDELKGAGFVDCFRIKHPKKTETYSWWSYRQRSRERNKGWRIDYFWISESIQNTVTDCSYLMNVQGSDHCPVLLNWNGN